MKSMIVELDYYEKKLITIKEEIKTLPAGHLVKRGEFYCHAINGKEVGITNNTKLIAYLSRKKYLLYLEKKVAKYISILTGCISRLKPFSIPEEIISTLPSAYQNQPFSHFFHPSASEWIEELFQTNSFPLDGQTYITEKGIEVRSKTEFIIADLLEKYCLPYRYDSALNLFGRIKYPDFIILNPFNGKIIIWEHFGGIDFPGYEKKMNEKMSLYKRAGYIPFETLIYTFECDVDVHNFKELIENIILKP